MVDVGGLGTETTNGFKYHSVTVVLENTMTTEINNRTQTATKNSIELQGKKDLIAAKRDDPLYLAFTALPA